MKIEPGYYKTCDGSRARVLCVDAPGDYPVVGYIENDGAEPDTMTWTLGGRVSTQETYKSVDDLIEPWREPRHLEFWTNLYPDGRFEGIHMTEKEAKNWAEEDAVAVYVTGTEGVGPEEGE